MMPRKAIIFDGRRWHVRRIRSITYYLDRDEEVYCCDMPISNNHRTLAEVPEVLRLIQRVLKNN